MALHAQADSEMKGKGGPTTLALLGSQGATCTAPSQSQLGPGELLPAARFQGLGRRPGPSPP